ncbi:MAG: hypothetical protein ACE5KA_08585, partial [Nitrososphaerales archaeon]
PPTYDPTGATTYRIDLISERGNMESTTWPPPPILPPGALGDALSDCEGCLADALNDCEDCTSAFAGFAGAAGEAALAQQTGSIILNYTAFAVIFQNFDTLDGIDQTGWKTVIKGVPGYPAWRLPANEDMTVVVRVKNKDWSGKDLELLSPSGMVLSIQEGASFSQTTAYICAVDESGATFSPGQYNDSNPIVLPNVFGTTGELGWTNLYFCDTERDVSGGNTFVTDFSTPLKDMTYFFMIIRADFVDNQPYSQTIPYQALMATKAVSGGQSWKACLKTDTSPDICEGGFDKYQGSAGEQVKAIFESAGSYPYSLDWVDSNRTYTSLGEFSTGNSYTFTVPDVDPGYYVVQATDASFNVYYMTFKVNP